ncbi:MULTISPECIES: GNAT family N-acetyltransferase [unclassified Paracoccus (in: a-proteobacteria)]|uniref:GNAT family N-acetyltransferase n=1 Tax=unclassified Paracoccus (in: a-proteobacteria) TaxID=2688777 RepID=UPI0016015F91|nr:MULTISPECIES: GNAT family protein [unclassified Paracoccus (in: a-proteobacteria)]MBB1491802.1 GNAT family N-acetyltransferase [Paracoccus sp. MC1854]MBB1496897.1 GNAT family N-acetyltransferase [Paracoccus sp. MC1862]QQO45520.1 GNAT family N-acetyltransferase [Paracoccus sp. MC1862]
MAVPERPLGAPVPDFTPPLPPGPDRIEGRFVVLERLDPARHADDLFQANDSHDELWDYMGYGPFTTRADYRTWQDSVALGRDPFFYALRERGTGRVAGVASFLRIDPANGVIEIGHIQFAPALQRTAAASEAIMLMIAWAFGAGYRRVEWKCNALNAASMRAAGRYGFAYEGIFRNHMVIKGRNRDTAWWAITDTDWPAIAAANAEWLSPGNFDAHGRQRRGLRAIRSG